MKKNIRRFILLAGLSLVAFAPPGRVSAEPLDKIVAVVNSDVITDEELGIFMKVTNMESADIPKGDPQELRRMFLDRLVEDRLMYQEAVRTGLKAEETAIEDRIKDMKLRVGSERAFDLALRSQGLSINDLRQKFREQYLVYQIIQSEVKAKVQVSPKEITDYFEAHRDAFAVPETAIVDSLFVDTPDQLAQAQVSLANGRDFLEAAQHFSKKSNLGSIRRGQFKKELEDFVFGLTPGKPSDPFAVDGGFFIFLLRKINPVSRQSVSEVKDAIKVALEEEKSRKALREFVETLKDKAYISIREA